MDPKLFLTVFATVLVAELGDKTQLATLLYAADAEHSRWTVFAGAATALVVASGLGVLAGSLLSELIPERAIKLVAGAGFIGVGLWVLLGQD